MGENDSYQRLPSSENDTQNYPVNSPPVSRYWVAGRWICTLLGMTSLLAIGFIFGFYVNFDGRHAMFEPIGDLHHYMHFNGSFAQRASDETEVLWNSLFPDKFGFVQHPEISPNVSGIAAFHELHCLNILRQAFFAAVDGDLNEKGAATLDANHRISLHHIRHCFEYLRQSLICLADSNLEAFNYTTQGVSGWQSERQCRDFEGLRTWANKWGITKEEALSKWNNHAEQILQ